MFHLYIWVPTKGWKFARSFTCESVAISIAKMFEPLEVKVTEDTTTGEKTVYQMG